MWVALSRLENIPSKSPGAIRADAGKGKKLTMKTFNQAGGPNERGSRKTTCDLIAVVIGR